MPEMMIVLVVGFVLGTMGGIFIGWSAAPVVVWRASKLDQPQAPPAADAVGLIGGL